MKDAILITISNCKECGKAIMHFPNKPPKNCQDHNKNKSAEVKKE